MNQRLPAGSGILVDSNLLVLLVIGNVNPRRIETFKRTCRYTKADYDLLLEVLSGFHTRHTLPHVLAEVSNLSDLSGPERFLARLTLKAMIAVMKESPLSSWDASEHQFYESLGLVDAAIAIAARDNNCAVLTDDLALYARLNREGITAINFTHLRKEAGII
jgi:predicted nucleic acid-binding protein